MKIGGYHWSVVGFAVFLLVPLVVGLLAMEHHAYLSAGFLLLGVQWAVRWLIGKLDEDLGNKDRPWWD